MSLTPTNNAYSDAFRTVFGTDIGTSGPEFTLLYFSAHWCNPCRRFTPFLSEMYSYWVDNGQPIEVIFVSSDRSESQFEHYSATMPWQALPYGERKLADRLKTGYGVRSIPSLLVFDKNGQLVSKNGRQDVQNHRGGVMEYWRSIKGGMDRNPLQ